MPTGVPIKERIVRQVLAEVNAITDLATARRWDARGVDDDDHLDARVIENEESVDNDAEGNIGWTHKTLNLEVCVKLIPDESVSTATASLVNRWQAEVEKAVMADPYHTASSVRLAQDTKVTGVAQAILDEGIVQATVRFAIQYAHDRNDPFVLTGVITRLEE